MVALHSTFYIMSHLHTSQINQTSPYVRDRTVLQVFIIVYVLCNNFQYRSN